MTIGRGRETSLHASRKHQTPRLTPGSLQPSGEFQIAFLGGPEALATCERPHKRCLTGLGGIGPGPENGRHFAADIQHILYPVGRIVFPDRGYQIRRFLAQFTKDRFLKSCSVTLHFFVADSSGRNRMLRERFGKQFEGQCIAGREQTLMGERGHRPDPSCKARRLEQPAQCA